ncbi:MAG: outer membrane beta-barrel protein [Bacteroides sp.]|nr:outer membrane beta-barrel protein [Bacteroides sp.]
MRTFSLFIFLVSILSAYARDVKGVIVDENGDPAEFVNVMLMNDSIFIDGQTTDESGHFLFENVGMKATDIRVSLIGYEEIIRSIPAEGDLGTIRLKLSGVSLGEVQVKSMRPITRLKDNAFVTTVQGTMLATTGSANDVLSNVPMLIGKNGNYSVFGSGDAVIYINGRKVRDPKEVERILSTDIKEVQVISNPGSQYGSGINAVVRIVTLRPVGEGFSAALSTENTINNSLVTSEQFDLKYRHEGLELFANLNYYFMDKLRHFEAVNSLSTTSVSVNNDSKSERTTLGQGESVKVGFNYDINKKNSIGAYFQSDYDLLRESELYRSKLYQDEVLTEQSESDGRRRRKGVPYNVTNVYYQGSLGKLNIDFNGDYLLQKETNTSVIAERNQFSDDRDVSTHNILRNRLIAEKLSLSYDIANSQITVGEEYTDSRSESNFENPENILISQISTVKERNMDLFGEYGISVGSLYGRVGVRYERNKSDYLIDHKREDEQSRATNVITPSASLSYRLKDVSLALSFRQVVNRPPYSALSGNYTYINPTQYARGNPFLKPSRSNRFILQSVWKYFTFQSSYIYTKDVMTNLSEPYEHDDKITVFTYKNFPSLKRLGLYAVASPTFGVYSPSMTLGMSRQWFSMEYLGKNKSFNSTTFNVNFRNRFTLPNDWNIVASWSWQSHGGDMNWVMDHCVSSVGVQIYKFVLKKALGIYLEFNDIFNGSVQNAICYSGMRKERAYVTNYNRNVELTLRYNFNTTNSRYKGQGAGNSEKNRL